MNLIRICALLAIVLFAAMPARAGTSSSEREIEQLIGRVAASRGVVFVRNGREHAAGEAAAHLRRKFDAARGRIDSTEQFIERIGARSSITGTAYRVRLPDGRELESGVWLRQLLRGLRADLPNPRGAAKPQPPARPA